MTQHTLAFRFTPTCVGNTLKHLKSDPPPPGSPPHAWGILSITEQKCPLSAVHPHMRGEYDGGWHNGPSIIGSPPHAWGIRSDLPFQCRRVSVHPHMRGEYNIPADGKTWNNGSPPHAWGILFRWRSTHRRQYGSPPHAWGIL